MLQKLFLLFAALILSGSLAVAGWTETHGGDQTTVEFKNLTNKLVREVSAIETLMMTGFRLSQVVLSTPVRATNEELVLQGVRKVAVTKIEKNEQGTLKAEIWIHADSWAKLSLAEKELLIIHEYFHLVSNTSDEDYIYSGGAYDLVLRARKALETAPNVQQYIYEGFMRCSLSEHMWASPLLYVSTHKRIFTRLKSEKVCESVRNFISIAEKDFDPIPGVN